MTDFTSGYTTLLKKQWRALVYDYDAMTEGIGDVSKLYCLTNFQVMWLQQNVDYFRWQTRWNNLSVDSNELSVQADALELALMTCIDIQPFMLEFNYNQAVSAVLNTYNVLYDAGGIPELNSNTPTDFYSGDDSEDRINALCTACNVYIKSYATNWLQQAQVVLGVTIVVSVGLSLTGVGGLIAGTVLAGLALFTQTAMNAMNDNTAINNVICCMNTALDGAVVNQTNFTESLDSCGFGVGTNEQIIVDIISSDMGLFDNWLSFLNNLGDSYVLAQVGVSDCPCFEEWTSFLDFTVIDPMTLICGTWVDGTGYICADCASDKKINANLDFDTSTVTSIEWDADIDIDDAFSPTSRLAAKITYKNVGSTVVATETQWLYSDILLDPFNLDNTLDGFVETADELELFIRCGNGTHTGSGTIRSVTIKGIGFKPPQLP